MYTYVEKLKRSLEGKQLCVYPMGIAGKSMLDKLSVVGIKVDYFSDKDCGKWGEVYKEVKCISPSELCRIKENTIVIVESLYYQEIKAELAQMGIDSIMRIYPNKIQIDQYLLCNDGNVDGYIEELKEILGDKESERVVDHIVSAWRAEEVSDNYFESIFSQNQYFDQSIIDFDDEEVMVDVGAYVGDSAEAFYKICEGNYSKMHLFELDPTIYSRLCDNIEKTKMHDIVCWPFGAGDKEEEIFFDSGDSSSTISEYGKCKGLIKPLDDILDEKVTFIKMDIEGAEMSALSGAKGIIQKYKPKLAICIYHSAEDMFRIPQYIKTLVPEYKLYIRHYTDMFYETVCYAVI